MRELIHPEALEKNIWKYAIILISNKRVFVAILGVYYLTIPGVTAWWIGTLLLIGSTAGFLLELPSGYISDKIGHKEALVISRIFMLLSTIFFLLADNIVYLILAGIFLSASWAFHSGAGSAFMHETLKALGKEDDYSKVMGKISSIGFAIPIVFMVLVPFLVSISYKLPFAIALVIDLLGLIAAIALVKPPVTAEHIQEVGITNFKQVMQEGRKLHFFRYALFSGIVGGMLLAQSVFRAPYQAFLDIPVIWFGVFFGVGRALASLMLAYSGKIKDMTQTIYRLYFFELIVYAFLFLMLGLTSAVWIVVAIFIIINAVHWGFSQVNAGYLIGIIKESKFKATLLSSNSLISEAMGGVAGFLLGFAIERVSYQLGFLYLAIIFLGVLTPLYFYLLKDGKYLGNPATKQTGAVI